jgi:hypothetical protein
MLKSGIIFGVIGFVLTLLLSLVSPICSVCVAIGLGLGAGYVAGVYERPLTNEAGLRAGLIAGGLTGGLMIPGGIIAAVINAGAMQGTGGQAFTELFGLPPQQTEVIWAAQLIASCCVGLINLGILAGFGAGGGALWFSRNRAPVGGEPIPPAS